MALTIENGTGVSGANSYATVAEARAFAADRGLVLPAADTDVEPLLVKACDYLQSLEPRFIGYRALEAQALAWPRAEAVLPWGVALTEDAIPVQLKQAQCRLAYDAITLELQPNGDGREVVRRKVDVLETEYAQRGTSALLPTLTQALNILQPLLKNGFGLSVVRV